MALSDSPTDPSRPETKNIVIVKSADPRRRHRFIAEPLEGGGHDVRLIDTKNILAYIRALMSLRKANRPDAVVVISAKMRAVIAVAWCRLARLPVIVRVGGNPIRDADAKLAAVTWAKPKAKLTRWLNRRATGLTFRLTRHVITVTNVIAEELRSILPDDVQVHVVPQYCDGPVMTRDHALPNAPVLLTVTNLSYRAKAEGTLWLAKELLAFSRKHDQPLTFRIAGGGEWLGMLRREIAALGDTGKLTIESLGFVDNVDAEFGRATLFLYRSDHDALPNVMLEAKRWSLPVLVNDYPPFLDIVTPEVSGLIYGDAAGFEAALERLISDRALRERLATAGQQEHLSTFTPEASLARLLDVFATTREG